MSDSSTDCGCCRCCFSFILTSGLTALFMWLSLRTSNPVCSIQDFYVPALNKSSNSSTNHTIYFDLKLDNENNDKGIYYDAFNLTFSYNTSKGLIPVGNYTVKSFRQGHKKKARRKGLVNYDDEVFKAISNGSMAVFRVDMATKIRFRIIVWKTKKYKLAVGAPVEVNENGKKGRKKGIRLKSGAPCYRGHVMGFLVAFSALVFLLFT